MVDYVTGIAREVREHAVILDIGGIGILVSVASGINFSQGKQVTLITYLHWHEEQGPSLFGFESYGERDVFLLIIGCSGAGPKLALAILGALGAQGFIDIISRHDDRALSQVNGIGPKKAEQLIMQLKHKIKNLVISGHQYANNTEAKIWQEVSQVLESLSYTRSEITQAMNYLAAQDNQKSSFDQLVRQALSFLARRI